MQFSFKIFITFICVLSFSNATATNCTTSDGRQGICKDLRQCSELYSIIAFSNTKEDLLFLRNNQCETFFVKYPEVCCTSNVAIGTFLPPRGQCGVDSSNKILGGSETDLDEFPWNCRIEYVNANNQSGVKCGCVLINQHYVLTAAHCVNIPTTWRISRIHFGEWDTTTNPDCVQGDCAPPVQKIPVEKLIPHPEYQPSTRNRYNDIALIRLAQPVEYNDFVKPICLPLDSSLRSKLHEGEYLVVSGWGLTETGLPSTTKMKLRVVGRRIFECNSMYLTKNITVGNTQLCAGGDRGRDSCSGDSGGPLVAVDRSSKMISTYLAGIVSMGPTPCGLQGWPGVYTKVSEYVDWILNSLEP